MSVPKRYVAIQPDCPSAQQTLSQAEFSLRPISDNWLPPNTTAMAGNAVLGPPRTLTNCPSTAATGAPSTKVVTAGVIPNGNCTVAVGDTAAVAAVAGVLVSVGEGVDVAVRVNVGAGEGVDVAVGANVGAGEGVDVLARATTGAGVQVPVVSASTVIMTICACAVCVFNGGGVLVGADVAVTTPSGMVVGGPAVAVRVASAMVRSNNSRTDAAVGVLVMTTKAGAGRSVSISTDSGDGAPGASAPIGVVVLSTAAGKLAGVSNALASRHSATSAITPRAIPATVRKGNRDGLLGASKNASGSKGRSAEGG